MEVFSNGGIIMVFPQEHQEPFQQWLVRWMQEVMDRKILMIVARSSRQILHPETDPVHKTIIFDEEVGIRLLRMELVLIVTDNDPVLLGITCRV
jgi:hypothetical protein